ncbi:MAG TPA: sigma-70 family RNA polymerase sigma factor [Candidatus Sulfopaludibacter sp.]|nr:sigma-70 family RNA polymerase sigma factor [Candidatus Sulfopaludibacter sp.]
METDRATVTRLLQSWGAGDQAALEELMPLVYDRLRVLAGRYMHAERAGHTLRTTALVHEVYLQLVDADVAWRNRAHFYAIAARLMRRVLVEYARKRGRAKRGAGGKVTLDEAMAVTPEPDPVLLELDDALTRLADVDERKAQLIEMTYFGGLSYDDAAEAMGISPATVHRELRLAKAWLYNELKTS